MSSGLPDTLLPPILVRSASGAAFILLFWEWIITLDDEVEYIWSKPNNSWLKWLFIFSRYYTMAASLTQISIESAVLHGFPMSRSCLRIWYSCQVIVALHSMSSLELILMTRVYALYNKSRRVWWLFFTLYISENAIVVIGLFVHYPGSDFQAIEVVRHLPASFSYFGFCTLLVQLIIIILTLLRYLSGSWKTVPIVRLMLRDGTLSFSALTVVVLIMSIFTIQRRPFAVVGFSWLLTVMSSVTCRLIINMLKLPMDTTYPEGSTGIQFSTIFTSQHSVARSRWGSRSRGAASSSFGQSSSTFRGRRDDDDEILDEYDMSRMGLPVGAMMVMA